MDTCIIAFISIHRNPTKYVLSLKTWFLSPRQVPWLRDIHARINNYKVLVTILMKFQQAYVPKQRPVMETAQTLMH